MDTPFYITGGTLPTNASSYVVRRADADLLESLRRGEFCYVLNTRQMGKSSLMIRTAEQLREDGVLVAVLDLTAIGQNLTHEQWYFGLLTRMCTQLGLLVEMQAFWRENREIGPMQRFFTGIRNIILEAEQDVGDKGHEEGGLDRAPRLVIFVDEIDAVRSLSFSADEFFAGIRECYNHRTQEAVFKRLTFCLLGVATPADLIRETRMSPFNIGRRIELNDFTVEEAAPLALGLTYDGLAQKHTDSLQPIPAAESAPLLLRRTGAPQASTAHSLLLSRVLYWTNGHPYMTQRLCQAVAKRLMAGADESLNAGGVDQLCEALFLSRGAQETDDNLAFVRNRLLRNEQDLPSLLDLYLQIRAGRRVKDDETNPLCSILKLSGVVKVLEGRLQVRNRVYDRVFDRDWVTAHMPGAELRRQQIAYRRGVIRAASLAGCVIVVMTVLAILAANSARDARIARDETEKARKEAVRQQRLATDQLSRSYVATGNRLISSGDYGGALAPLVEALRLDGDGTPRAMMGRMRIATVLRHSPRLERIWFSNGPMNCAVFSPDGRFVATAGADGNATIWDVASNQPLPIEMHHEGGVSYLAFSGDARRLVTCGADGVARVWSIPKREMLFALKHSAPVSHAAWSHDGRRLLTCTFGCVTVWDVSGTGSSAQLIARAKEDLAQVTDAAFDPSGERVVVIASNYLGWINDARTGNAIKPLGTNALNRCFVGNHVEYSPDGKKILVAGAFGGSGAVQGACLFDALTGAPCASAFRHSGIGTDARFSPDGSRIVTASEDQTARVWDAKSGKPITPALRHEASVAQVAFSPDGRRVLTASIDGRARLWDATSGALLASPLHHAGSVQTAAFSPDGCSALTAGKDGTARIWNLASMEADYRVLSRHEHFNNIQLLAGGHSVVNVVATTEANKKTHFVAEVRELATGRLLCPPTLSSSKVEYFASADGSRIALLSSLGAQVWDTRTGKPLTPPFPTQRALLSPDGSALLLRQGDGNACIMDVATCRPRFPVFKMATFSYHPETGGNTPFSPDSRSIVQTTASGRVQILDAITGSVLTPEMRHDSPVWQVSFSPDGKFLITWAEKGMLQIWDAKTGGAISAPYSQNVLSTGPYDTATFSPNSRYAITTSTYLHTPSALWDLNSTKPLRPKALLPWCATPCFSPDGRHFVLEGQDICVWDAESGKPSTPVLGHGARVNQVTFSPDGRRVVTASGDSTARVWDAQTGRAITPPMVHMNAVYGATFSPDGGCIVTWSADGSARMWNSGTGEEMALLCQQRDRIKQVEFTQNGANIVIGGEVETDVWSLPSEKRSLDELAQLALLLSGKRIDAAVGTVNAEPESLRRSWKGRRDDTYLKVHSSSVSSTTLATSNSAVPTGH